ncbi:hypothetical protein EV644_1248 [Kribbella orskensis]|uniref:Uncharacterized protein n=1 Tax=Kribbella orskensis TaxID=2512216 RepID=A0ABY2B9U7_9ACTN|nr:MULTISPECIES: hypothetical protein [Kribbella]TCN32798.1 hypothetical protein EV642_12690 [Kribbella sp. VKM Ac-2500]TCO12884.1 hypothetical protein EV644_1248 [Kribbella orskensis]
MARNLATSLAPTPPKSLWATSVATPAEMLTISRTTLVTWSGVQPNAAGSWWTATDKRTAKVSQHDTSIVESQPPGGDSQLDLGAAQ